ncbi:hypothetical protein KJ865_05530, partial [Myxococcota bacterium]|nr:hypothetical protein [Myxococcota bacterium]
MKQMSPRRLYVVSVICFLSLPSCKNGSNESMENPGDTKPTAGSSVKNKGTQTANRTPTKPKRPARPGAWDAPTWLIIYNTKCDYSKSPFFDFFSYDPVTSVTKRLFTDRDLSYHVIDIYRTSKKILAMVRNKKNSKEIAVAEISLDGKNSFKKLGKVPTEKYYLSKKDLYISPDGEQFVNYVFIGSQPDDYLESGDKRYLEFRFFEVTTGKKLNTIKNYKYLKANFERAWWDKKSGKFHVKFTKPYYSETEDAKPAAYGLIGTFTADLTQNKLVKTHKKLKMAGEHDHLTTPDNHWKMNLYGFTVIDLKKKITRTIPLANKTAGTTGTTFVEWQPRSKSAPQVATIWR